VAVTERTARLFHLQLNGEWRQGTNTWKVVGTVENPRDLLDTFALVAPGQASPPDRVTVLFNATPQQFAAFVFHNATEVAIRPGRDGAISPVLVPATIGLLFVGLLAVAGFT